MSCRAERTAGLIGATAAFAAGIILPLLYQDHIPTAIARENILQNLLILGYCLSSVALVCSFIYIVSLSSREGVPSQSHLAYPMAVATGTALLIVAAMILVRPLVYAAGAATAIGGLAWFLEQLVGRH